MRSMRTVYGKLHQLEPELLTGRQERLLRLVSFLHGHIRHLYPLVDSDDATRRSQRLVSVLPLRSLIGCDSQQAVAHRSYMLL